MTPTIAAPLRAPFPYFGGKSRAAPLIWQRFGDTKNYVEPFAGSLAVLLARPYPVRTETVNDANGYLANFWRALTLDPDNVAKHADYPVNETDLLARHIALVNVGSDLTRKLEADPEYFDAKLAGWWVWGANAWIGSGWCTGTGPWNVRDGQVVNTRDTDDAADANKKVPHLGDGGHGTHRIELHEHGVKSQLPHLGDGGHGTHRIELHEHGVKSQLPHLSGAGQGTHADRALTPTTGGLHAYLNALAARLRRTRVTCGDFTRVLGPSVTTVHGTTSVLLDPPYQHDGVDTNMYTTYEANTAARAEAWALEHGHDARFRIALCGYDGAHDTLLEHGWTKERWKARTGYRRSKGEADDTAHAEIIYFSPHCLTPENTAPLFAEAVS